MRHIGSKICAARPNLEQNADNENKCIEKYSIFDAASPVNRNYLEQTETQQFKRWFGRSSVVQADGTPRAVRQGVDATVEVLDGKTALQDGEAVYVKLENPYPAGTAAEVPDSAALEAGGYDGAVYQDGNGGTHYAVLDGTQLKSATDNAGTFDGRNPNLRFSQKAGERTSPGEAERQGVDGRTFTYEEFMGRYRDGVEVVRVRELNTFRSPADRKSLPSSALREARRNGNPKNTAGRAYIYFPDTGTNAYVDENSFRHGNAAYDTQYALACMNATKIAQSALAVNTLEHDKNHRTDATVYLAIAEDNISPFIVRFIVTETSRKASMDVLYAIKKEGTFLPSADSYFTVPTSQGDAAKDSLKKANAPRRASSHKISIEDFLQTVNGTAAGNAVLSLDVLRHLRTGRGHEPRVSPNLRFSEKTTAEEWDAAPERYLEDGHDAEAWEAYWSEVKAGAKGRPAVQRPATRSERLRRAWELFDNGMTPVQYWRQSREEARQASELRLFDDGQPAADTFDPKTSNLLRGLMLQNGESVGGALSEDRMSRVMGIFSHARPRVAAALSLLASIAGLPEVKEE